MLGRLKRAKQDPEYRDQEDEAKADRAAVIGYFPEFSGFLPGCCHLDDPLFLEQPHLEPGHKQDHRQEHNGLRHAISRLQPPEGGLIHILHDQPRRISRSTCGQEQYHLKSLRGVNRCQDNHQKNRGPEHRQGDPPESLPRCRSFWLLRRGLC